jgi:hypothetical protein
MKKLWFLALLCSICLEGLGRKYLPGVPSVAFYLFKDIVLIVGYLRLRPAPEVDRVWRYLYRGFGIAWIGAVGWTILEALNPEGQSVVLAAIGLRAYWLWWLAPAIIAGVLQDPKSKRFSILCLSVLAIGISALAMVQFVSPPTSAVNLYSTVDGEAQYADTAVVASTGRARVASTFSFLSGFADFGILIPTILLSLGLGTADPKTRRIVMAATLMSAVAVPMSGSRGSLVLAIGVLAITAYSAGLFFTVIGRRILIGGIAGAILATVVFPEALQGVSDRFGSGEETQERVVSALVVLPPVALLATEYPPMGIGTGMQQNARVSFGVYTSWSAENENQRYLVELGPVGFLLVWTAKLGLAVALLRARRILRGAGRLAASGAALSYAMLTFLGNLTFDHIFQALYFLGVGIILAEVVEVVKARAQERPEAEASPPVFRSRQAA